jgi:hypothetical protein
MMICRYCEKEISGQDKICGNCGYNPQTDTMTTSFVKKKDNVAAEGKQKIIGSGVKSFVFWGMVVIILSLGMKYQGKLGDIFWEVKNTLLGNKVNKSAQALKKANQNKSVGLSAVRAYQAPAAKLSDKNKKIEGIFYDLQGKSYVVISGQLVSENESYGDRLIKKINPDSVEILQNGQEQVVGVDK